MILENNHNKPQTKPMGNRRQYESIMVFNTSLKVRKPLERFERDELNNLKKETNF